MKKVLAIASMAVLVGLTAAAQEKPRVAESFIAASIFAAVPDVRFDLVNSTVNKGHGTIEWVFTGTDKGLYKT